MNTISDVITASYATSKDADLVSKDLKKLLGCEANYEIARLALGRSLMLDDAPPTAPDGKGSPLRGLQLFGGEADGNYLWIALLSEQLRLYGQPQFTLEALQQLVRNHWHRGVNLLEADMQQAGDDEAKFLDLLARRAALPETLSNQGSWTKGAEAVAPQVAASDADRSQLLKKLKEIGVAAEIRDSVVCPRLIRYRMFLSNAGDLSLLDSKLTELGFSLAHL